MIKKFLKYWLPLYLYAGIIFYMSGQPHPLPSISMPYFDKSLHLIEYAVFGILAGRAFKSSPREVLCKNFKILAVLAAVTYGASDEFHQLFVACRNCDVFDLVVDSIGGTIGVFSYGRYNSI